MRLTVGPLPPAVYWRRRAVVLGAGILFLIVLLYSCGGPGDSKPAAKESPSAGPAVGSKPTAALTPETGAPPGDDVQPTSAGDPTPSAGAPDPGGVTCTDAEVSVVPAASNATVQRGVTIVFKIKIKNVSSRSCTLDVGADIQEIYLKLGAETVWSSDTCGTAKGNNVKTFPPAHEETFEVPWNGKASNKCTNGFADGEVVRAGEYQLFGRLGTKHSEPMKLVVTS
ncbi:hypothetical protein [Micromonospora polyrhachis]|uniref:DUF4232 domain-containing protein n=1 Tax=Micromonospora polyrhachis TaxID=1282883 RepID=A0A7W7SRB6_9ACTN|nr:hypothetical protein [Micromonospora polyrhachis]MBB4959519.1 hypothetical protein [Micromonospora polyrhachis]